MTTGDDLQVRMSTKSTQDLRAIVESVPGEYTAEALHAANVELAGRSNEASSEDRVREYRPPAKGGAAFRKFLALAATVAAIREIVRIVSHYFAR